MHVLLRVRVTRVDSTLGCLSPQVISSLGYALAMHYPLCRRTKYDSQRREFRVPQRYQNEDFEFFQHHIYIKIYDYVKFYRAYWHWSTICCSIYYLVFADHVRNY